MKKNHFFTYHASGEVRGNIWMPNCECTKEFNINFSRRNDQPFTRPFETLQDIKNHITNDGDFQSCYIDYGFLEVTLHYGNRTLTRLVDISER